MSESYSNPSISQTNENIQAKGRKWKGVKWILIVLISLALSVIAGSVKRYLRDPLQPDPSNISDREWAANSYGFAPHPNDYDDPVIQVYSARTRGPKKALAVHTWIATKRKGADQYIVSQIFGWRLRRRGTALMREPGIPDKAWYRNEPTLLLDLQGKDVELIIDKVDEVVEKYPWSKEYSVWPGPNSNTFIAWLGLQIPELRLDLPSTAIGKDWRPLSETFGRSVSGTGVQASLLGLLGITIAFEEGLEVNILGLSIELDLFDKSLELPGIGRVW